MNINLLDGGTSEKKAVSRNFRSVLIDESVFKNRCLGLNQQKLKVFTTVPI